MASTSSSPLLLFIDTDQNTHILLTIDGDQSISQLKAKIITDHANCFPQFGEISVLAVKTKCGEFFYHISDSMILNCFFQSVEGAKRFQVDIVCGDNVHNPKKANFGSYTKDDSKGDLDVTKRSSVEHGNSSMSKIGDTSQKKKLLETDEDVNCKSIHESGIAASTKESSPPSAVQHVELSLLAKVDDTANDKIVEVPFPSKPLNDTATDKMLKHGDIKENSTGNDPTIQFSNDPASQIPKERFILGYGTSPNETTSEATGKHEAGIIASLDNSTKEVAQTQKRRHKRVVRKIPSLRLGNGSKKSNEDGLAPTFVQSEKNDVSGSNTHDTEKAKSGSHTKDQSNVNLDSTKMLPDKIKRKRVAVWLSSGRSGLES